MQSVPPREESPEIRHSESALRQKEFILLALMFVTALGVRLYSLKFFHVISTDGTSYVQVARSLANGDWNGVGSYGFYPVLIWAAGFLVKDGELAGRLVSILSGSLLVIPLYLLGKEIFSRNVALSACLVAIVWPPLINSSCEVMTQATHTTLQLTGVYFVWRAFKGHRITEGCLAGFFFGLTFLTRPEGLLLFFVTPVAFLLCRLKKTIKKPVFLAAYSGSFLVFFIVNLVLVHHVTGEWQVSAKTDAALNDALSYYLNIPDLNYIPGYEPKSYLEILKDHPGFIWKNSFLNLKAAWKTMLPVKLWLLFIAGFVSGGLNREKNLARLFLGSTFAPVAVLVVFYYIATGYIEAYLPVMFLFAASGFYLAEVWCKQKAALFLSEGKNRFIGRIPVLVAVSFIYSALVFFPQIRKDISDAEYIPESDNYRRDEKHIGLLLKESLPPGKIMTRWARIAFYSEREWANIPAATPYEEIIRLARTYGVRFFIADGALFSNRPMVGGELFDPLISHELPPGRYYHDDPDARVKGLRPFMLYTDPRSMGVVVYEIP